MEQTCKQCKYAGIRTIEEPCFSCEWNDEDFTLSNFTPKKDINQFLREKLGEDKPVYNPVSKPSHYMLKEGLEVRDVIKLLVDKFPEGTNPMLISDFVQAMQYGMRFMDKGGKQDLEKMRQYLDWMIEAYE